MVNDTAVTVRRANQSDLPAMVETVTQAFLSDPLWAPVFPDVATRAQQSAALWRLFVSSAQRYPWTFLANNAHSVAVWIPPGGVELTGSEEQSLHATVVAAADEATADRVMATVDSMAGFHPHDEHYYLSLLATNPIARGHGLGIAVLRENLARIDEEGMPAYLESSNPANIRRYESVGFRVRDEIVAPSGHHMASMWRPVGGSHTEPATIGA